MAKGHLLFDDSGKLIPDAVKVGTLFDQLLIKFGFVDELYVLKKLGWVGIWTVSGLAIRTGDNEVVGKVPIKSSLAHDLIGGSKDSDKFLTAQAQMKELLAKCHDFVPAGPQPDPLAKGKKLFSGGVKKSGNFLVQAAAADKAAMDANLILGIDYAKAEGDMTVLGHVVAAHVDDKGIALDIETGPNWPKPPGPIEKVQTAKGETYWKFNGKAYATEDQAKAARSAYKTAVFGAMYGMGKPVISKPTCASHNALGVYVDKLIESGVLMVENAEGQQLVLPQLKASHFDEGGEPVSWTFDIPGDKQSMFGNDVYVSKKEAEAALKKQHKTLIAQHLKSSVKGEEKPSAVAQAVEMVDKYSAGVKPFSAAIKETVSAVEDFGSTLSAALPSAKVKHGLGASATEGMKMVAQAVSNADEYKKNLQLPVVKLADAKGLLQRVHGSSGGSVYITMAMRPGIKVAVARSSGKLKIRAEGPGVWAAAMQARLAECANLFNVYPNSHVSSHISATGVQAEMAYAGILAALSPNGEWSECLSLNYLPD